MNVAAGLKLMFSPKQVAVPVTPQRGSRREEFRRIAYEEATSEGRARLDRGDEELMSELLEQVKTRLIPNYQNYRQQIRSTHRELESAQKGYDLARAGGIWLRSSQRVFMDNIRSCTRQLQQLELLVDP